MSYADHSCLGISHYNRYAISCGYAYTHSAKSCHERIDAFYFGSLNRQAVDDPTPGGMSLPRHDNPLHTDSGLIGKQSARPCHVIRIITRIVTQIHA